MILLTSCATLFLLLAKSAFSISTSADVGKERMVVSSRACRCFCCCRKQARSSGRSPFLAIIASTCNHVLKGVSYAKYYKTNAFYGLQFPTTGERCSPSDPSLTCWTSSPPPPSLSPPHPWKYPANSKKLAF